MCDSCREWSGFDTSPFETKSVVMDGVDANARPEVDNTDWLDRDPTSRGEFQRLVQDYVDFVFREYGFDTLTRDMIEVRDSKRMTRYLGKTYYREAYESEVAISWDAYQRRFHDWEGVLGTIRHELTHASNYADFGFSSHGPTFIREAKRLDCPRLDRYDEKDPRYFVVCGACGATLPRKRLSKAVKHPENLNKCGTCGAREWERTDGDRPPAEVHPVWQEKLRTGEI